MLVESKRFLVEWRTALHRAGVDKVNDSVCKGGSGALLARAQATPEGEAAPASTTPGHNDSKGRGMRLTAGSPEEL